MPGQGHKERVGESEGGKGVTKMWTCDYQGCGDIAQWCVEFKGKLLTLCTKHNADFVRNRWGKIVDPSNLKDDDIRCLKRKEEKRESVKRIPFEIVVFKDSIKVKDRQTGESRRLINTTGSAHQSEVLEKIAGILEDLKRGKFSVPKLSIDEFLDLLKQSIPSPQEKAV